MEFEKSLKLFQTLLTGFIQIFLSLFPHVKSTFRREDVESLGNVLISCVEVINSKNKNQLSNFHDEHKMIIGTR